MKQLSTLFTMVFFISMSFASFAQNETEEKDGPVMTFESMIVDYGNIVRNSERKRTVKFTNTGTEPLVITNARGSCGCTVPSWPKQPVMPGETSQIEINYDTNRVGSINKTVTVTTNEVGEAHVLKVVGKISDVAKEDGVPAPKNGLIKPGKNKN